MLRSRAGEEVLRRIGQPDQVRSKHFGIETNVAHVLTDAEFAALLEAGPDALVVTDVPGYLTSARINKAD
jgi:hypothetical protein